MLVLTGPRLQLTYGRRICPRYAHQRVRVVGARQWGAVSRARCRRVEKVIVE
jgi:hypothetical protein